MLPATTVGSFPQTDELRTARVALRAQRIPEYDERIEAEMS